MAKLYGYMRSAIDSWSVFKHQTMEIDAYCRRNGVPLERMFRDVCSGYKPIHDRTGWTAMEEAMRPGDVLLVEAFDRISRNHAGLVATLNALADYGIRVEVARRDD